MIKKLLAAAVLCAVIVCSLAAPAFAAGEVYETQLGFDYYIGAEKTVDEMLEFQRSIIENDRDKTLTQVASEHDAIVWHFNPYGEDKAPEPELSVSEGESWDDVVAALFSKYDVYRETDNEHTGRISLGYYNTVTGEEHFHSGDEYFVSASVFKIPENMAAIDRLSKNGLGYDANIYGGSYSYYQYRTISHSDNQCAWDMFNWLGGYEAFKTLQKEYLGSDPQDDLGYEYLNDNYYTARQIVNCLKILWENQDRYNGIIQNMLQANPYEYFRMFQRTYPVAQKYGFVEQTETNGSNTYINCAGIIYTDQPVILTVFTDNLSKGYDIIGEYASLMGDYAQMNRQQTEAVTESEDQKESENEPVQVQEMKIPEQTAAQEKNVESEKEEKDMSESATFVMVLVLAVMILAIVFIFRRNTGARINSPIAIIAIILAAVALVLCIFALNLGTLYTKTKGNPQDTVTKFFDSLTTGNMSEAYSCLGDYSSLGFENQPKDEAGQLIYDALKKSWSYTLMGDSEINKLEATQSVALRCLNLEAVKKDAAERVDGIIEDIVESRPRAEVYDETGKYLDSVTDEVYITALKQSLAEAERFYTSSRFDVKLTYDSKGWIMTVPAGMVDALLGGVS